MSDHHQHIEPELSVGEIMKLYLSHWRMFVYLTAVLFGVSMILYVVKIPYVATTSIVFNDSQNSSVQAFSNQFYGLSKSVQESKKGSSLLSKHIEFLKTREFFEAVLAQIPIRGQSSQIMMEERQGFDLFKSKYLDQINDRPETQVAILQRLDKWTKTQLDADFEIKVSVATPDRAMSLFLVNTVTAVAKELLERRELEEISRIQEFMKIQKQDADQKLTQLGKELASLQSKDELRLPLASQSKMAEYVSELLIRANELKLKISGNEKLIAYLKKDPPVTEDRTLYGTRGKIEALEIENKLSKEKLEQLQTSIDQLKNQTKELPFQAQMAEDLKKKSELEFARFKELSVALAKIEAAKLSVGNRFEVMEGARWETTQPQIGILALALLSILVSQFMGSLIIYFRYLWNPNVVTAQASRNLVVFDNYTMDPRVIIENSKIKFSLKQSDAELLAQSPTSPMEN
ncbi:MAG: hypothetical protein ACM3MG_13515 [Bacillota bacterium]